jgi:DNA-binding Lrp family transcriptional regulator
MDKTDRRLMILIAENPRTPYRDLADKLGVSVQAIHRRIQLLMKMGVIREFSAGISIRYLRAVPVIIFGKSDTLSVDEAVKRIGTNELSSSVLVAGGNILYVSGLLKNLSDLERYVEFVRDAAEMPQPTVGIYSTDAGLAPDYIDGGKISENVGELTQLDMRIIAALQPDCRKPVADVAKEIGVSSRTVSRRLQNMIDEGTIDLVVPMDPTFTGEIVSMVHIHLNPGADKRAIGTSCINRFAPNVWYLRSFTNMPNFLMCIVLTDTTDELREILREIGKDPGVRSIVPNVWFADFIFHTWRDRLVSAPTKKGKKA